MTITHNIFTNCVCDITLEKAIIKIDNSDHLPIISTIQPGKNQSKWLCLQ